ncbi:homocysteine S-methyltransferase family protein [Azospirillum sp. ST 5-10]|uniref:homocysteine S-methyltransferase family protein n=1 Tax=unclassified Azospirillum TaxID=2630922 RepID=UPI003F4A235D
MARFAEALAAEPFILTDGGIETRILYETALPLHPQLEVAGLVLAGGEGGAAMERLYADYLEVGRRHGVPMIVGTPTFRAHPDRIAAAGLPLPDGVRRVNTACAALLQALRATLGAYAGKVFIAGVIGPRGDAYRPAEGAAEDVAAAYHRTQAEALAAAGVDLLFAPAFPAAPESVGAARAMAATGLPYALSVVVRGDGTLLDGTPLDTLVRTVDARVSPRPLYYALSCVHTSLGAAALTAATSGRVRGLKANGSRLPPEELVALDRLDSEPPEDFAAAMLDLHARFGLRVLGGCCGTGPAHIDALAGRLRGAFRSSGGAPGAGVTGRARRASRRSP